MPTVLTGGMPQARITDMATCVGPPDVIVQGSRTVFVGSLPAARIGDRTAHGGVIVTGFPTVLIGDKGGGGGGGAGGGGPMGGGGGAASSGGGPGASDGPLASGADPDASDGLDPWSETCSELLSSDAALPEPFRQAQTLVRAARSGKPFCERCS